MQVRYIVHFLQVWKNAGKMGREKWGGCSGRMNGETSCSPSIKRTQINLNTVKKWIFHI